MSEVKQKACLICIDGWGIDVEGCPQGDAILNAKTPVMDHLEKEYPFEKLAAHGLSVGLPDGLMGNSEVGHLNIGAGRVVYQDIVRIELALKNGSFATSKNVSAALNNAKNGTGRIHFFGLVSDGGVHSHITHLFKCLDAAKAAGVPNAYVHFIADGRDTQPKSAVQYLMDLQEHIRKIEYGTIADIIGRYYAMDRDKRWERVKIACDAYVKSEGEKTSNLLKSVGQRYAQNETDEFLKPIIGDEEGRVKDGDTLFFFNFRSDRMREITQAFGIAPPPFETDIPKNLHITTMTQYKESYPFPVAFPPQTMDNVLAEWLGKHKVPQSHVAETEKYAHVTFFFNGGCEAQFDGEDRVMVSSPKVATYDLKPEMSAKEVGDKVAEEIACGKYPFVMCNFAPPDMVGHTGLYEAAIKGVEATDKAIGVIYEACKKHDYVLFVTSDHGNAEKMISEHGGPHTAHTCNPVPFVMTSKKHKFKQTKDAALCDVAPTILDVMGLPKPADMTGQSLLAK